MQTCRKWIKDINHYNYLDRPYLYPHLKPPSNYVIKGESIFPFESDNDLIQLPDRMVVIEGKKIKLRDFLRDSVPLEDRIPVIGYGSNPNPHRLYVIL